MNPGEVLAFWFGAPGTPARGQKRDAWFRQDAAFDSAIGSHFGALHEEAAAGGLAAWEREPDSAVALVVVLDQFSRNLHRGSPRAFAQDARALALSRSIIERQWDRARLPVERQFVYLPFEHSEGLADQDRAVALIGSLEAFEATRGLTEWAEKHRVIIRRFGRFPHRNAALGRASTPEEVEFLKQPGSSF